MMKRFRVLLTTLLILLCTFGLYALAEGHNEAMVVEIAQPKEYYVYTGAEIKPEVVVTYLEDVAGVATPKTLTAGVDYDVAYEDNIHAGTAEIIVTGKNEYAGEQRVSFKIILAAPAKVTSSPTYNSIKLSWDKVNGAEGYVIYRSTSKSTGFACVKTVESTSTTTYTDSGLNCGTTYYYKVAAFSGDDKAIGLYSAAQKQKVQPGQTTITKVSRETYKTLKVTWKKVSGATSYAVYRSTSRNGTYKKVGTAKNGKLSFVDKTCSCGKKYYYKVKAYRSKTDGIMSEPKSGCTRPAKVSISGNTTYNSTKITLKWKKASGAQGYEVWRSTSKNGTYKKVKTITSGKTVSWTNKGLKKKTVYYYKVRSYNQKIDKTTLYGPFSSVYKKTKAGWRYVDGYKLYYNSKGKLVKDVSSIIGEQDNYVIKVNKKKNTVTVYAKDGKKGYIIPVKAFVCSTGYATPLGTFRTPQKLRWHELMGPCWGQWCTRITGSILFHSVWYHRENNNNTLSVSSYNRLGTTASHGCVRLTAGDAKWIYDNCDLKTKVIVYNSSDPGPLGKPKAHKLKSSHTWDPTDPNMKAKCKKKGCH